MSLLDVVRAGVEVANKVTKPLQATVSYWRYIEQDHYGTATYSPAFNPDAPTNGIKLRAIVDWKQKQVRTAQGVLSVSRALVGFIDIKEVVAATNGEGFNDHDVFILPDGTTGPVLDMTGFTDAGTGHPVATEVYLG